jgi:hypothetical protein
MGILRSYFPHLFPLMGCVLVLLKLGRDGAKVRSRYRLPLAGSASWPLWHLSGNGCQLRRSMQHPLVC